MLKARILLSYQDSLGVFRFLVTKDRFYTLDFSYNPKFFLESQIKAFIGDFFALSAKESGGISVKLGFRETLEEKSEGPLRLYLAVLEKPLLFVDKKFLIFSFPELIRELPKNRERLLFLKAFQILSDDKSHLTEACVLSEKEFLEKIQKNQIVADSGA